MSAYDATLHFATEALLAELTLEEKAAFLSGATPWQLASVPRLGVPQVMMTDGPHGLRKQAPDDDFGTAEPATCFPPAVTLGSTWDVRLLEEIGRALGREARAQGVSVLLGPGINIKRSPLCGRNFEYLSEDPVLSGDLGAALVTGIQAQGVGTALKHFAANNQETDRLRISADIDERTLREVYLAGFERVITRARPWTVMCSYNRINGVHTSQDPWLLTDVLRTEWGFDGVVMSDWGAVHDRVAALIAGLDLEMPGTGGRTDAQVVAAVRDGSLDEVVVDTAVRRILQLIDRSRPAADVPRSFDIDAHHDLAREAAAAGAVLLKNDPVDGSPILPLDVRADSPGAVVVGALARTPRYQGAGSSQVVPTRLDEPLAAIRELMGDVPFAAGYSLHTLAGDDEVEQAASLLDEAVTLARTAKTVLLFLGLPDEAESEGYDRTDMDLPAVQTKLLAEIAAACPRVVVVLANGSAVTVAPWNVEVPAILESWLGGQAGGSATAEILVGLRSPGGRLAETIPVRLSDTPSYFSFPGEFGHARYAEGVLVGYRGYDARHLPAAYPFGHGLTYTSFAYSDIRADVAGTGPETQVTVDATIINTGARAGTEVVQVYVSGPPAPAQRPARELKAFTKVHLAPGESTKVTFRLDARDFSYWHPGHHDWALESGEATVWVGSSSADLRGRAAVHLIGEARPAQLTMWSTLREVLAHPTAGLVILDAITADPKVGLHPHVLAMDLDVPMCVIAGFNGFDGFAVDPEEVERLLEYANADALPSPAHGPA